MTDTPPVRRRRRGARGMLAGLGALVIIGAVQAISLVAFESANARFDTAADAASTAQRELQSAATGAEVGVASATAMLNSPIDLLVTEETQADLTAASSAVAQHLTEIAPLRDDEADAPVTASWLPWELWRATAELDAATREAEANATARADAVDTVTTAADELSADLTATTSEAVSQVDAFATAHINAKNLIVLTLRDARTTAVEAEGGGADAAAAFVGLTTAAQAVADSDAQTLAAKGGPLYESRLAVEAFARELAPGVLLDFSWAPIVNGVGEGTSMGGYATWWYDRGGYATLEFSNSVAELWPSTRAQALVAHEVGHAISVICPTAYDSSTSEGREAWATAWAISRGFTDDANGTSAYGPPPADLIPVAAQCG